jgi:hypothetical protein
MEQLRITNESSITNSKTIPNESDLTLKARNINFKLQMENPTMNEKAVGFERPLYSTIHDPQWACQKNRGPEVSGPLGLRNADLPLYGLYTSHGVIGIPNPG